MRKLTLPLVSFSDGNHPAHPCCKAAQVGSERTERGGESGVTYGWELRRNIPPSGSERALDCLLFRINDPGYRPSRVATVAEFAERWKEQVLSERKPSTKKAAESHLGVYILLRLGKLKLDDLAVENQQMFVGYLSEWVSRNIVLNVVGTLSSMLNAAKNWGYICEGVSVRKPQRLRTPPQKIETLNN